MHIAIVGCGQLSRMLALAGIPLGIKFSFINDDDHQDTACVDGLGTVVALDENWRNDSSLEPLYQALGKLDCITIEKEQVDSELLVALQAHVKIYPNIEAIKACQHRLAEKKLLENLSIATAPYLHNVSAQLAMQKLNLPMVVKSCREGYDGKNQWQLKTTKDVEDFDLLLRESANNNPALEDYIVEAWVPFEKEVSLISVRSVNGEIAHYPLTENTHESGILKSSIAPARQLTDRQTQLAQAYMEKLLTSLDYVGVLAMECFIKGDELVVNELAPRVHNSGHWTQMGSVTCQFENHVRALCGQVLGSTELLGSAGMVNLIGTDKPPLEALSKSSKLYWYNKSVRPMRKLGHINFLAANQESLDRQMNELN
ncbi:5-(carboxyamino)imidazole ribonucleotide synthase [Colwelliaceae bacterium 6471]